MPKRTDIKSILIIGAAFFMTHDSHYLFGRFVEMMRKKAGAA